MGDSRFTSIAYGKYNNFAARTDGLFAESDTTPDVTNGCLFYSSNTSSTTITHFDLSVPGGGAGRNSGAFEGKVITVFLIDDSTRLANAGNLVLAGSDGLQGANSTISLLYHNSAWVELHRSRNISDVLAVTSAGLGGAGQIDARGRRLVTTSATAGSAAVIRTAINGEQGQRLTIVNGGSSMTLVVNSAANNTFVSSSSTGAATMVVVGTAAFSFIRVGNVWIEERPAGVALNSL